MSASDAWAVGSAYDGSTTQSLVEHWDGASWTQVASPNPGTSYDELLGGSAVSGNDVFAVGDYYDDATRHGGTLVERWDGTGWKVSSAGLHRGGLSGVSADSATDVWSTAFP
ncbi:MAG: hypothetical protein ACR2KG_11220 [Nocardioidaceae bacterium]